MPPVLRFTIMAAIKPAAVRMKMGGRMPVVIPVDAGGDTRQAAEPEDEQERKENRGARPEEQFADPSVVANS
jgi:hypothetical protein